MQYTTLGKTDIKISRICLGTMTWGFQNTQEEGFAQMDYALDEGVNFWDTSEMYAVPPTKESYGTTETIIGNWFAQTGRRDEVILATKITPELPYIRDNNLINRANILAAVESSLIRLQTDHIDLYQLHWPSNRNTFHFHNVWDYTPKKTDRAQLVDSQLEALETLDELIQTGKIRSWGLSNDTAWGMCTFCQLADQHNLSRPVSLQNEYSLLRRRDDLNISEVCMIEQISHLPWSPLAMGVLSGKYLENTSVSNSRLTLDEASKKRYGYRLTENVEKATSAYISLARAHNLDPCQMAIAFCLSRPFVASPIIGASSLDQLKINLGAIDVTLNEEILSAIDEINKCFPDPF